MKIQVYDPAMCCSTGACGPAPDPRLAQFSADLKWLEGNGVEVRRFNLAQEPAAFTSNPTVARILTETDGEGLPIIEMDGRVLSQGLYPDRAQLAALVGLSAKPVNAAPKQGGCCGPSGCC